MVALVVYCSKVSLLKRHPALLASQIFVFFMTFPADGSRGSFFFFFF